MQRTLLGQAEPHVEPAAPTERVDLDGDSWIDLVRGWLVGADSLLDALVATVDWRCGRRWMFDRMVDDPRLSRWYASGRSLPHPALSEIRARLAARYGVEFGGVGLNYYRNGRDSVAFHRDRELRRLDRTLVAIVTLGATRPFLVRHRTGGRSRDLRPGAGDLLVMGGRCQADWEHGVPKVARAGPRISVSVRWTAPREADPRSRAGFPGGARREQRSGRLAARVPVGGSHDCGTLHPLGPTLGVGGSDHRARRRRERRLADEPSPGARG
jgi:alkylated DNA repair dioxygenase AlkB